MKRAFDLLFSALGLIALTPVFLMVAVAVRVTDGFPILFRQQRVGQGGRLFTMLKFRSMAAGATEAGPEITADGDPPITRVGRILRRTKLDELPQLWNVLVGDMSFVGPRPEVLRYVERYTPEQRRVLALKPGITDPATLEFRDEEELLRAGDTSPSPLPGRGGEGRAGTGNGLTEVEEFYMEYCLPRKIELSLAYAARATLWSDLVVIVRTVLLAGRGDGIQKLKFGKQKTEMGR